MLVAGAFSRRSDGALDSVRIGVRTNEPPGMLCLGAGVADSMSRKATRSVDTTAAASGLVVVGPVRLEASDVVSLVRMLAPRGSGFKATVWPGRESGCWRTGRSVSCSEASLSVMRPRRVDSGTSMFLRDWSMACVSLMAAFL